MSAVNGLELKTPEECERIYGDNNRLVGYACRKCGLLYTAKNYREDYQQRAETCCQDKPCPTCGKKLEKYRLKCFQCSQQERYSQFAAKPESVWDGKYPVTLFGDDKYFFHDEELSDYLADIEPEDYPEIEACDEMGNRCFSVSEHVEWDDEHGDIGNENDIDDYVNKWIKDNVPPRYIGNCERITEQVYKSLGLTYDASGQEVLGVAGTLDE